MKLITNKKDNTVLQYFPQVDYPKNWQLSNPAVFQEVKNTSVNSSQNQFEDYEDYVVIDKFVNLSQSPKYLLFKLAANLQYILYTDNNYSVNVFLYDYLQVSSRNIINKENYILQGIIGGENTVYIRFNEPSIILMQIFPYDYYSLNNNIRLYFSEPPLNLQYDAHWQRDWKNKIDGTSWNITGKIYRQPNIVYQDRRHFYIFNKLQPYKRKKVYAYALKSNNFLGNIIQMKKMFSDITDDMFVQISDVYIQPEISFLGFTKNFIVKMKFLYFVKEKNIEGQNFSFNGNGQIGVVIDNDKNFYDENHLQINIQLNPGFHYFQIYYNAPYDNYNFVFNILRYGYYDQISNEDFYLTNNCDTDVYIPYNQIYKYADAYVLADGYLIMNEQASFTVYCRDITNMCTISMMLYFYANDTNYPYVIMESDNIIIQRINKTELHIRLKLYDQSVGDESLNELVVLECPSNIWHHLCLILTNTMISWYFDLNNNGYKDVNISESFIFDNRYVFGKVNGNNGNFLIYNVVFLKKALKQNEVNRLYMQKL